MVRRRAREREKLVNPIELGWVRSYAGMNWGPVEDDPGEIASRHFVNRQFRRGVGPVAVNSKLKRAVLAPSIVDDIQNGGFDNRLKHYNEWLQGKIAKNVRLFCMKTPKSISNLALFQRELDGIKRMANKLPVPAWCAEAVAVPIGPERILKFITDEVPQRIGQRRFLLLNYNNHNTSVIFVQAKHDAELAKRHISDRFEPCHSEKKEFELSAPNCGYAMRLKYGQEVEYVGSSSESPYLLCIDDVMKPAPGAAKREIKKNTEYRLKSRIRQTRLMSVFEKRWIEKRMKRKDLIDKGVRLVEFYTAHDKDKCLKRNEDLEVIDLMYNPMMFNHEEVYETAFLQIQYDIRPIHREGVKVTVTYEYDKDFTEAAFTSSGLRVYYFDETNESNEDLNLKFSPRIKSMVCQDFPSSFKTFEDRVWFIQRIAAKNFLEIEAIEEHVEEMDYAKKSVRAARKQDLPGIINYELYKVGHHNSVFRPMDIPWDIAQNGGRGARFYADIVMTRPDVPWHTNRVTNGPKRADELYSIHFKSADDGIRMINDIIDLTENEPVFRCDKSDDVGPTLIPTYRKTTPITRRMRAAFNKSIHDFDDKIRMTFPTLSDSEDPLMAVHEAAYYWVRVYEDWDDETAEKGLIGVEGWNTNGINHFFQQFLRVLKPVEFAAAEYPELLCGIGEIWVKNHEKHFQVLIDIDKYRQVISIFGTRANEVVAELQTYQEKKPSIRVQTRLPTFFPLFNDVGRGLLDGATLQKLSQTLSAKAVLDPKTDLIDFTGTIEAYLEFTRALDTISAEVYKRFTRTESMECPACFCETDVTCDFFRFHCGHEMCRPCLNNMVSVKINESEMKIECAYEGCSSYLTPQELLSIVLGGDDRIRELDSQKLSKMMSRAKEKLVASSEGTMTSCTTIDCVGILTRSPGDVLEYKKCITCERSYCRHCLLEPHPENTCADYARLRHPDHSIAAYVKKEKNTKCCPKCGIWVQKSEGCNHMTCKCGAHFCWICLFVTDDGPGIYGHMNEAHNTFGGEFQVVNGRLQANPGHEDLQVELDMQRLMLGPNRAEELVANQDIPLDNVPLQRDPRFANNEVPAVAPRPPFPRAPPGLRPLAPPPGFAPIVFPPFLRGPDPIPPPPMPLDELPQELLDEFPNFFNQPGQPGFEQEALGFLNNVQDIEQREERLEAMRHWLAPVHRPRQPQPEPQAD